MAEMVAIPEGSDYIDSVRRFLQRLLEQKKVDAVLVPKRRPGGRNMAHALIADPSMLGDIDPFAPVQMENAARFLQELGGEQVSGGIAAVLRPCEVRAAVELVKLKQIEDKHIYLIGYDCPGTFPAREYVRIIESVEDKRAFTLAHMANGIASGQEGGGNPGRPLRESCTVCASFTGESADVDLAWIGLDPPRVFLEIISEKGRELLRDYVNDDRLNESPGMEQAIGKRKERVERMRSARISNRGEKIDNFLELLQTCMRCYNCREACPLCYCKECLLIPEKMGYSPERHLSRAVKRSLIKMPVDTLLYHLTKINHMGALCVACGMCEQACPMEIPLGRIYEVFGRHIQALFDYMPGRDRGEELPMLAFREEELSEVEDL